MFMEPLIKSKSLDEVAYDGGLVFPNVRPGSFEFCSHFN